MADHGMTRRLRIRDFRVSLMLTQHDVAERLEQLAWLQYKRRVGVNADMVSKWERGEKQPSPFYRKLLCTLYDASPTELGLDDPPATSVVAHAIPGGSPIPAQVLDVLGPGVEFLMASLFSIWRDDMLNRRQMLQAVGIAPVAIGFSSLELSLRVCAPSAPAFQGADTIASLHAIARRLEEAYHAAPPDQLLLPARALADAAECYLASAAPSRLRQSLFRVVARGHLLAGRLSFFDLHRPMEAHAHLALARDAAVEAQDPMLASAALGHMAFLPAEHHQLAAASSYLDAARRELEGVDHSLIAGWIHAVESEVHTLAGQHRAARMSLDHAQLAFDDSAPELPDWFDYFDGARLLGFEGFAMRRAGDLDGAERKLVDALAQVSPRFPKQRAVTMIDLGSVCAELGDLDRGCALATDAVVALRAAGYATAVDRLREFRFTLSDSAHPAARLLDEAVVEFS